MGDATMDGAVAAEDPRLFPVRPMRPSEADRVFAQEFALEGDGPVAVGDVTGDGRDDLVCSSGQAATACLFVQSVDGELERVAEAGDGLGGALLVLADLDGDGGLDIVRAASGGISVQLTRGDERSVPIFSAGPTPTEAHATDLDRDGHVDILASSASEFTDVAVYRGVGAGAFDVAPPLALSNAPLRSWELADVTGDGVRDLIALRDGGARVAGEWNTGDGDRDGGTEAERELDAEPGASLVVFAHDGAGAFRREPTVHVLTDAPLTEHNLSIGDVDGDGRADVLASGPFPGVAIFRQTPEGTLERAAAVPAFERMAGTVVADVDGDGRGEIIVIQATTSLVRVFGRGAGGYVEQGRVTANDTGSVLGDLVVGDLNSDGCADLVTQGLGSVTVFRALCDRAGLEKR